MLLDQSGGSWYMDSGAPAHLSSDPSILHPNLKHNIKQLQLVVVGDCSKLPITSVGSASILTKTRSLSLNDVLVAPKIVKNLMENCF